METRIGSACGALKGKRHLGTDSTIVQISNVTTPIPVRLEL